MADRRNHFARKFEILLFVSRQFSISLQRDFGSAAEFISVLRILSANFYDHQQRNSDAIENRECKFAENMFMAKS